MNDLKWFATALICCLMAGLPARNAQATIAQTPLFLVNTVKPNIMFTLDDSSSMALEIMPDDGWTTVVFPLAATVYGPDQVADIRLPDPVVDGTDGEGNPIKTNVYAMRARSNSINRIYYNPTLNYVPWTNQDGTLMDPADIDCALHNPVLPAAGCLSLTAELTVPVALWQSYDGDGGADFPPVFPNGVSVGSRTYWPAVYYQSNDVENSWDTADYTKVEIRPGDTTYAGSDNREDCENTPTCTYGEEIQNFANWYTYYRSRILLARAGIGNAFSGIAKDSQNINNNFRIGFAAINSPGKTVDGVASAGTIIKGVRPFVDYVDEAGSPVNNRTEFFENLYQHPLNGATPLRQALDDVGQYFQREDNSGPWGELPGTEDATPQLSCRLSYNILMTDGYWNGAASRESSVDIELGLSPVDGDDTDGPAYSNEEQEFQYKHARPFSDSQSETLADVAMFYWKRDLHTILPNNVPVDDDAQQGEGGGSENAWSSPVNPAFWQHLVNITVGLGVSGTLNPSTDLPALTLPLTDEGAKSWPVIVPDSSTTIDDLWHTAVNSHGGFFAASDPEEFYNGLHATLERLADQGGSAASIAANSTRLDDNTFIYQARFDSGRWSGDLWAFELDADDGTIKDPNNPAWEAAEELDERIGNSNLGPGDRKIFTIDDTDGDGDKEGVAFTWSSLSTGYQGELNADASCGEGGDPCLGESRVDYLRGDRSQEVIESGPFRTRDSALGDIINSDPWYLGKQDLGYNLLPGDEGSSYISYRNQAGYQDRPGVVYVGANDGMLHAFHGVTGKELFAYIPGGVMSEIWRLTDPGYTHRYFVDGGPIGKDAYIGSVWKSVVAGTTGGGGKSVFALDVSNPANFTASNVLWEFGPEDDPDGDEDGSPDGHLGYTIGQVSIVRMAGSRWAAVFGNGYESASNQAVLYIVDIADGAVIKRIVTPAPSDGDADTPNGMSTPVAVDINGDRIVDRIYGGDLRGRLWAFDVSSNNTNDWKVDYTDTVSDESDAETEEDADVDPEAEIEVDTDSSTEMPLFEAKSADGRIQPITAKPQVGRHPRGGVLVFFGTGKYYDDADRSLVSGQIGYRNSFYGIWDNFNSELKAPVAGRTYLLDQEITHESTTVDGGQLLVDVSGEGESTPEDFAKWDLRVTSNKGIDWSTDQGWYLDLRSAVRDLTEIPPRDGWEGERVVSTALLLDDRVVFSTVIPNSDACDFGGTGWLMELEAEDGSRPDVTVFDLNGDGAFNSEDYVEVWIEEVDEQGVVQRRKIRVPANGKDPGVGIIKTPTAVRSRDQTFKYVSGSTGEIERTAESLDYPRGRQSWRQLR
ncbi:MAG: pilus assembly protein [Gammaproteobacteria bacterium]|nr:pilus assembly protein [Gammaproteobacteria bacterium]